MSHNWNKLACYSTIGALFSLAIWLGTARAEESSVLVNKPPAEAQTGPALPPPANPRASAGEPNGVVAAPQESATVTHEALPTPPQASQSRPLTPTSKRPFLRPAVPREGGKGQLVSGQEPFPAPTREPLAPEPRDVQSVPNAVPPGTDDINVRPTPPIDYDTDRDARRMYRSGEINVVMLTRDPSDGCTYEIPMCIPACCEGEPSITAGRGIFGRGIVEYCWPCGFRAKVKFRHVLGDIKVEYEGD